MRNFVSPSNIWQRPDPIHFFCCADLIKHIHMPEIFTFWFKIKLIWWNTSCFIFAFFSQKVASFAELLSFDQFAHCKSSLFGTNLCKLFQETLFTGLKAHLEKLWLFFGKFFTLLKNIFEKELWLCLGNLWGEVMIVFLNLFKLVKSTFEKKWWLFFRNLGWTLSLAEARKCLGHNRPKLFL